MKKSKISLFLIAAIFMMSLLVFEASALTAYGQPCTTNSQCTSNVCRIEIDTFKSCGCSRDSDCSDSRKCNTANNFCMNKKITGAVCIANSQCYSGSCTSGRCAAGGPAVDANKISGIVCETGFPGWLDHLDAFGQMIKVNKRMLIGDRLIELAATDLPANQIAVYGLTSTGILAWGGVWDVATGDRGTGGMLTIRVTSIFNNPVSAGNRCADVTATRSTFAAAASASRELSVLVPATGEATPVDESSDRRPTIVGTACTSNANCPSGQTCQACPSGARCSSTRLCMPPPVATRCSTNAECGTGKECAGRTWVPTQRQMKINGAECANGQECATGVCFSGHCVGCTAEGTRRCPTSDRCGTMGICQAGNNIPCYSPLRCQSGFCSRAYGLERGICLSASSRCTSDASCPTGNKCNIIAGICEIRGECRTIVAPTGGDSGSSEATRCSTNAECGTGKECAGRTWVPTQRQMKINGAECANGQECATGVCFSGHCVGCTTEGTRRCPTSDRCGTMGICQSANTMICFSPLRCQSGFCERAYGQEQGRCQSASSRCTSDASCPAGNKCNIIAGICEIRGECRTTVTPAGGGTTDTCASLSGVDRIKCDINALIANMQARAGRL